MIVVGTGGSSWPVEPAHRVGAFLLGMGVNEALAIVQRMGSLDQAEFSFDERRLFDVDMSLRVSSMGFQLCFDGLQQDLRVIAVDLQQCEDIGSGGDDSLNVSSTTSNGPLPPPPALPPMAYSGRVFASARKPAPTLRDVCTIFGPTWIGDFQADLNEAAYFLRYPGLSFEFPLPSALVEELAARGEHPTEIPGHPPPTAARMWVYAKEALSYLDGLSALPDEPDAVVVRPAVGVELRGRALLFGAMPQDVFSDFGPPEQVCVKDVDTVRIHSDGSLQPRVTGPDYYYNYFHLGLDVLFDGRTHLVKKVILRTNPPTHELFSRYTRCFFEIPIRQDALTACMQNADGSTSGQVVNVGAPSASADADNVEVGEEATFVMAVESPAPTLPSPLEPVLLSDCLPPEVTAACSELALDVSATAASGDAPISPMSISDFLADDTASGSNEAKKGSPVVVTQATVEDDGVDSLVLPPVVADELALPPPATDDAVLQPAVAGPSEEVDAEELRLAGNGDGSGGVGSGGFAEEAAREELHSGKRITKRERKVARQKRKKDMRSAGVGGGCGGTGSDASPLSETLSSSPSPEISVLSASPESSPILATLRNATFSCADGGLAIGMATTDAAAPCDVGWDDLPPPAMPLDGHADGFGSSFALEGFSEGDIAPVSEARSTTATVAAGKSDKGDGGSNAGGFADPVLNGGISIDVRWPWARIQEMLETSGTCNGIGRPLVVSQGGHTPFGSTHFHAIPGLAFEVMQNGFVASLTVFSVPSAKLPPIFKLA
eukprot:TRINITY_DN74927_c0_g1_i1.p1 TRINITY_DN74927_c0_g1~~TRINITY_DN74927_c0_g1_i1.p1  ORF type:complete len:778 (+),score=142.53 TRINITY_DN74927_c0_g1_i1:146-2479(+)